MICPLILFLISHLTDGRLESDEQSPGNSIGKPPNVGGISNKPPGGTKSNPENATESGNGTDSNAG